MLLFSFPKALNKIMTVFLFLVAPMVVDNPGRVGATICLIRLTEKKHINSLECVKYVCRVGVVSKVESHVRSCPSV